MRHLSGRLDSDSFTTPTFFFFVVVVQNVFLVVVVLAKREISRLEMG